MAKAGPDRPGSTPEKDVEVRVYGSRRLLLPGGDAATVPHIAGESVKGLLERLKIPEDQVAIVVVNGVQVCLNFVLSTGDKVHLMSPVHGG